MTVRKLMFDKIASKRHYEPKKNNSINAEVVLFDVFIDTLVFPDLIILFPCKSLFFLFVST